MKSFMFLSALLITQNLCSQNFKKYCNARFSFCVSIPKDFKGLGESENGDGQGFLSKDRNAKISTFGNLSIHGINDLETRYKESLNSENITYKFRKANFFIISGIEKNGKVFYIKSIQKKLNTLEK